MRLHSEGFDTEPYETGWASEAIFSIRVHDMGGEGTTLNARAQISVDGIEWMDEGTQFPRIEGEGSYFVKVSHFGGWLRLHSEIEGVHPSVRVTVHLVLKE